jgi:hypothetical protein
MPEPDVIDPAETTAFAERSPTDTVPDATSAALPPAGPAERPQRSPASTTTTAARASSARSMVRRPGKGTVMLRVGKWGMGMPEQCRVREISESGVMFVRGASLAIGEEVEIDLSQHLSDRKMRKTAIVRRVLPVNGELWIGCEFESRVPAGHFAHLVK